MSSESSPVSSVIIIVSMSVLVSVGVLGCLVFGKYMYLRKRRQQRKQKSGLDGDAGGAQLYLQQKAELDENEVRGVVEMDNEGIVVRELQGQQGFGVCEVGGANGTALPTLELRHDLGGKEFARELERH